MVLSAKDILEFSDDIGSVTWYCQRKDHLKCEEW